MRGSQFAGLALVGTMVRTLVCTLVCTLGCALALRADDNTQKLVKRLGDEAEAFQKIAPALVGQETLHQRALAPPRFKMRVGDAAKQPQAADWKEHEIVSEY